MEQEDQNRTKVRTKIRGKEEVLMQKHHPDKNH